MIIKVYDGYEEAVDKDIYEKSISALVHNFLQMQASFPFL